MSEMGGRVKIQTLLSLQYVSAFVVHHTYVFFFFQAEDGIRDLTVTGVQTCALPISSGLPRPKYREADRTEHPEKYEKLHQEYLNALMKFIRTHPETVSGVELELDAEIGRASCRERV